MDIQKGQILTGKVTGITKFGAFVQLAPGKSGLVYISEIANTFVNNVADFLTVGQEVQVKVISIDEQGRINLSIKQAQPSKPKAETVSRPARSPRSDAFQPQTSDAPVDSDFEDKLKRFMKDSEGRISDMMKQTERRNSKRRR